VSLNLVSASGPLLPIQHVRCEVGSLSETGPVVLDARLSRGDGRSTTLTHSWAWSPSSVAENREHAPQH
jgi:hypothetical protein